MNTNPTTPFSSLQIVGNARYGGATLIALEWAAHLRSRGCPVDVLCTDPRMREETERIEGLGLVDDIFIPKEIDPRRDFVALRQLMSLIRARRYGVVHTYTATPSFIGRLAATTARVPVVVNHQGGWAVNETSSLVERVGFTPLEYIGNLLCTRNICVSHAERDRGVRWHLAPRRKLVTIINGIDTGPVRAAAAGSDRTDLRTALGCGDDTLLIGTTGRLVAGKGNRDVILAMAELARLAPEVKAMVALAGDGDERRELEGLAAATGVADRVRFLGFVDDVPAFLAALDVYVTASRSEGLSMALLEALASGTAVVSSDIPPNAEVVEHGRTGLLVSPGEPTQLAEAIARLAAEPAWRSALGRAAACHVAQHYSMERMFAETWSLYCHLLGRSERVAGLGGTPRRTAAPPSPMAAAGNDRAEIRGEKGVRQ